VAGPTLLVKLVENPLRVQEILPTAVAVVVCSPTAVCRCTSLAAALAHFPEFCLPVLLRKLVEYIRSTR